MSKFLPLLLLACPQIMKCLVNMVFTQLDICLLHHLSNTAVHMDSGPKRKCVCVGN